MSDATAKQHHVTRIESTDIFPPCIVDGKSRVYFDINEASESTRFEILRHSRPWEQFLDADGTIYCGARLLRRHLPREARGRFDEAVEFRKEQARDWLLVNPAPPDPPASWRHRLGRFVGIITASES